jgi:hypothetical protein
MKQVEPQLVAAESEPLFARVVGLSVALAGLIYAVACI